MKFWFFLFISHFSVAQIIFRVDTKNPEIKFENFTISSIEMTKSGQNKSFGEIFNTDGRKVQVGFERSVPETIFKYYSKYNLGSQPKVKILFKIKNLELTEKKSGNNIEGRINYEIEAYSVLQNDTSRLCRANNKGQYSRSLSGKNIENVQNQVKIAIDGGLSYVVNYIKNFGSQLEAFATDSEVKIFPFFSKSSADTVYYQQRKVGWNDFLGPIRDKSGYGAAIFTSFGYDSKIFVENHKIIVEIRPSVFTDKNMSWAKPEIKNDKGLRHEQLHFDISYLNSLLFLQKIKSFKAETRDDLISMIKYEYLEFYRSTHKMQEKYDEESDHSLNTFQQKQWESKVAYQIKSIDLKTIFNH
ncbi:MAG: hypothetical protein IPH28_24285 [Cytophagaceae bacterium]|nr:hypothetical protein [Cytophagaceae bacterium]